MSVSLICSFLSWNTFCFWNKSSTGKRKLNPRRSCVLSSCCVEGILLGASESVGMNQTCMFSFSEWKRCAQHTVFKLPLHSFPCLYCQHIYSVRVFSYTDYKLHICLAHCWMLGFQQNAWQTLSFNRRFSYEEFSLCRKYCFAGASSTGAGCSKSDVILLPGLCLDRKVKEGEGYFKNRQSHGENFNLRRWKCSGVGW